MTNANETGRTGWGVPATSLTAHRVEQLARRLCSATSILQVVAVIGAGLAVIGAIVLATQTNTNSDGSTVHPLGGVAFAVIVGAVIGGLVNWVAATAVRLWANNVALQYGFDAEAASRIAFGGNPGHSAAQAPAPIPAPQPATANRGATAVSRRPRAEDY